MTKASLPQPRSLSRLSSGFLSLFLVCLALAAASSDVLAAKTPVYTWDAANYYNTKQSALWNFTWVSGTSGPLRCQSNGSNPSLWYGMIVPATGSASYNNLQHGGTYTAEVTYYIDTPPVQPAYFYILARNSAGNQYDIWHQWNGEASTSFRTLSVPLDLKTVPGGAWNITLGIVGQGAIVLSSYVISEGSDESSVAAPLNGTVSSNTSGITAATGSAAVTITPPSGTGTYTASGMVADSPSSATANATAFLSSITTAISQGSHTIAIPPGKYWMAKSSSIPISSKTDLTIDGQGSTFVFSQQSSDAAAIFISGSSRLAFKNFNMDWDWSVLPLASLAKIANLSVSGSTTTCDFVFEDLDGTQTTKVKTTAWKGLSRMDPETLTRLTTVPGFNLPSTPTLSAGSAPNILHGSFTSFGGTSPLANGNYYLIRHADYGMAAFKVYASNNILFENVKIYSMTGMGWIFGSDSHHFALKNSGVEREPGSRKPFTTSRDGLHVMESQGYILLENSNFTGAGDDLINIHDRCYGAIVTVVDADTITLSNYTALQPLRLNNGDNLEFFNSDYSRLNGSATPVTRTVQSSSINGSTGICTINFTTPLPTPLSPNTIIRNNRYNTSNIIIKGCSFYNANGHGILISGDGVTLENNTFQNIYSTPLEFEVNLINNVSSPTSSWWEGDGLTNAIIRNNYFDRVAFMGEFGGAAIYARPTLPCGPSDVKFFDRISITNNIFDRLVGPAVALNNSSNVIVNQNQINYSETQTAVTNNYLGRILARRSSGLALGGNTWINRIASTYGSGVVYDTASTGSVGTATNALINFSAGASDAFETYSIPSTFTSGQTMGSAGNGWTNGWKTSSSYSSTVGSALSTLTLDTGNRLGAVITTQSGKTATSGAINRPFDAAAITQPFSVSFRYRTDSAPANVTYVLSDGQIASSTGGDSSSSWVISSINGTWQFLDGAAGGTSTYTDTGIPVFAGGVYDFSVTVNPLLHTWSATLDNGVNFVVKSGLHARASTFSTDPGTNLGARWLIFGVKEIVSGTSIGTTGTFSVDSVSIEY